MCGRDSTTVKSAWCSALTSWAALGPDDTPPSRGCCCWCWCWCWSGLEADGAAEGAEAEAEAAPPLQAQLG